MPLRFGLGRKCLRRFLPESCKRGHLARVFLPFLDHSWLVDDLDLVLVFRKTHLPAEALLVQASQSALVVVMIGRAEKRATEFAARDVGKVSLDRLGLSNVDLVKI